MWLLWAICAAGLKVRWAQSRHALRLTAEGVQGAAIAVDTVTVGDVEFLLAEDVVPSRCSWRQKGSDVVVELRKRHAHRWEHLLAKARDARVTLVKDWTMRPSEEEDDGDEDEEFDLPRGAGFRNLLPSEAA